MLLSCPTEDTRTLGRVLPCRPLARLSQRPDSWQAPHLTLEKCGCELRVSAYMGAYSDKCRIALKCIFSYDFLQFLSSSFKNTGGGVHVTHRGVLADCPPYL